MERYGKLTRLAMPTGSLAKHSARIQDEDAFEQVINQNSSVIECSLVFTLLRTIDGRMQFLCLIAVLLADTIMTSITDKIRHDSGYDGV